MPAYSQKSITVVSHMVDQWGRWPLVLRLAAAKCPLEISESLTEDLKFQNFWEACPQTPTMCMLHSQHSCAETLPFPMVVPHKKTRDDIEHQWGEPS